MRSFKGPVAKTIPFDNSSNGFPVGATNVQTAIESVLNFDPLLNTSPIFDDFDGRMAWSVSSSGTGSAASVGGGNAALASGSHIGVARVAVGGVLSASACLSWSGTLSTAIVVGEGGAECRILVRIQDLATVADDYVFRAGLGTTTNADHANGIYFEYSRADSVNWRCKTASQSTRTVLTTSTAVVTDVWLELKWVVNSAGDSVEFFIDDVSQGTITTNIPSVTGQGCGGNFQITAGALIANTREVFIDFFYFTKSYTSRQP